MSSEFNPSLYKSELTKYRIEMAKKMYGSILDVGGGLGEYLPYFSGTAVVLDINAEVMEMLDYPYKVVADATALPFKDDTFDCVWACAVCQYFDIYKFIEEAKRVTKNDGKIMILIPNGKSVWEIFKKMAKVSTWADQQGVFKQYSYKEVKNLGKVTGEIRFLPFEKIFRHIPSLGNTLMIEIGVKK